MTELKTRILGRTIVHYEELDSTSSELMRRAADGEPEGLVVVADRQTQGRGRYGRRWYSPPGGLWFSVLLRPRIAGGGNGLLPLAASLCMAETLEALAGVKLGKVALRWPNDLLLDGRKLVGVLCEYAGPERAVVLGVGLNLNVDPGRLPADVAARSVSLASRLGREELPTSMAVLTAFLNRFEPVYLDFPAARIVAGVRERFAGLGLRVSVSLPDGSRIQGLALDLDPDGALVLRTDDGQTRRILSGMVE